MVRVRQMVAVRFFIGMILEGFEWVGRGIRPLHPKTGNQKI
jgi:hypothetical protein